MQHNHPEPRQWLLRYADGDPRALAETQINQAFARLTFACAGLFYIILHADRFADFNEPFILITVTYFLFNLASIPLIKRRPISQLRCLLLPLLDVGVVCFSMLVDGGQSSGIFFILLVVILGNSFRFGNTLLLYTQGVSLLGLCSMLYYDHSQLHTPIDGSLLLWQVSALITIPLYVFLTGKRTEHAIQAQLDAEQSSFDLLDRGPLPVFTFDLLDHTPKIRYANATLRHLLGHHQINLVGESVDIITLPEDGKEMINFCRETLAASETASEQHRPHHIYLRSYDQHRRMIKFMASAIQTSWKGEAIGVCFLMDITERESIQDELEAMRQQNYVSTMIAGIVHDFRNVLTNMIGYAEILQMNSRDQENIDQLELIIAAGERGTKLITNILKLGRGLDPRSSQEQRITAGDQLAVPLKNIIGITRLQLPQHTQLTTHIDPELPDTEISLMEIEQILLNLIHNAIQAIRNSGHIHIHISGDTEHKLATADSPALLIRVADNGIGIPEDQLEHIFKPFWTSRQTQGGSGLGLATVQRIVKRRKGVIDVQSADNCGTEFCIAIPPARQRADATAQRTPASQHAPAADVTRPLHILLVDDMPDILNIHQAMLARMDHHCSTAENGRQALEIFESATERDPIDLIITDFRMPEMDGLSFIEHIRAAGNQLPIIMITAFGEDQALQEVGQLHVHILNKPINMSKLRLAINSVMDEQT